MVKILHLKTYYTYFYVNTNQTTLYISVRNFMGINQGLYDRSC